MTTALLHTLATLYALYLLYVFMMGAYRAYLQKRLVGVSFILLGPVLLVAFALDVFVQFTLASLVFWEIPRKGEWFVTHRLRRYRRGEDGWRSVAATWICDHLLDPFDPTGAHCDEDEPALAE